MDEEDDNKLQSVYVQQSGLINSLKNMSFNLLLVFPYQTTR